MNAYDQLTGFVVDLVYKAGLLNDLMDDREATPLHLRIDGLVNALRAEVRAEIAADIRRAELPSFPAEERANLVAKTVRATDARLVEQGAEAPYGVAVRSSEHGPLWSLLDWSFWGAGMCGTFREPLADTMLAAVPAETVAQAEAVMADFIERRKIEKTGVTVWQEQRDELKELRARVAGLESRPCSCEPVCEQLDASILVEYHHAADCSVNGGAR
ncbi:hypothetical protein [Streptomyces sp. NPDC059819]|uniref:hypothetical protein n=1 Tax=Streptomyces sp. NPDC059819 TaxID=3346963 RepID=UPI0036685D5C